MDLSSAGKGLLIGAGLGSAAGLGACMWILPDELSRFPGDTILAGAVICGVLGYIFGERFINWLLENWQWWV